MSNWTISNGTVSTTIDAGMLPAFVIEANGKMYVTILLAEVPDDPANPIHAFYTGQIANQPQSLTPAASIYGIDAAVEGTAPVNVIMIPRVN